MTLDQITETKKKKLMQAIKTLKSGFGEEATDMSLRDMESMLEGATVLKNDSVGGSLPLPQAQPDYQFYAFSDGACRGNPGPGAWGSLVQNASGDVIYESSSVEVPTTNNRMELQGAYEALKFLLNELSHEFNAQTKIALYSDSKYFVDGMKSWIHGWKKRGWKKADKKVPENVELWQSLDKLTSQLPTVHFYWVKGHSGHPQNEKCDQLANEALDDAGF